jgi:hypothetical protein
MLHWIKKERKSAVMLYEGVVKERYLNIVHSKNNAFEYKIKKPRTSPQLTQLNYNTGGVLDETIRLGN